LLPLTTPTPTALYPLSLHDALPISGGEPRRGGGDRRGGRGAAPAGARGGACRGAVPPDPVDRARSVLEDRGGGGGCGGAAQLLGDRKSTRLNSSHVAISYAVFCLKK